MDILSNNTKLTKSNDFKNKIGNLNNFNYKTAFLLSGEHIELPFAELKALLELYTQDNSKKITNSEGLNIQKYIEDNLFCNFSDNAVHNKENPNKSNYVIYDENLSCETLVKIINRAGYVNEAHKILYESEYCEDNDINDLNVLNADNVINNIYELLENMEIPQISGSFAVRVQKLYKSSTLKTMPIERHIGSIISQKMQGNLKVNLKNPDWIVKVMILKDRIYLSLVVSKRDVEYFEHNRPHMRAYFHPGCILPKLARCIVNLSRVNENDVLYDPFCGTGGFLIEAGLLGCKLIGSDIDYQMVNGTKLNLETYDLNDKVICIKQLDANEAKSYINSLEISKVDSMVTDPPYGISTSKKGDMSEIFDKLCLLLKKGGYMSFAAPCIMDLNLELVELYSIKVHKSLTRYIHVYKKLE
ncbi:THUMP domain-containing protein [Methanococcus voltae]|uniref:tRNA (guanine(10)-N(2))-dimethyltransferase n=2 Tax=Methanococcus voltae TaxID=2188 RepID=A0A8J7RHU6_METVO|nr:THUMP domain-containing protein [Methanococcus voltae]MBP2172830.1 tRNA (guanine10-N2)-dimethyltransferase [Methanococcus voltae]MBP2201760.1 tRNA (guanine10-N2)-dimethyltransferase [Methanococcus voltae]MCS3922548.1 tRNA (guanine10-N2)-dimethyltransferase [Methanococcus voltae PS]